jgi:hypothetical protein
LNFLSAGYELPGSISPCVYTLMPRALGRLEHLLQVVHVVARHQDRLAGAAVRADDARLHGAKRRLVRVLEQLRDAKVELAAAHRGAEHRVDRLVLVGAEREQLGDAVVGRRLVSAEDARVLGVGAQTLDAVRDQLEQAGAVGANALHRALDADVIVAHGERLERLDVAVGRHHEVRRRELGGGRLAACTWRRASARTARFAIVSWIVVDDARRVKVDVGQRREHGAGHERVELGRLGGSGARLARGNDPGAEAFQCDNKQILCTQHMFQ